MQDKKIIEISRRFHDDTREFALGICSLKKKIGDIFIVIPYSTRGCGFKNRGGHYYEHPVQV